jgi:peptidoglycan/LPS O-acetylase OafA/YrhL
MPTPLHLEAPLNPTFRNRIPALDGLRGIAILAVFFYHYASAAGKHTDSLAVRAVSVVFGLGWSGVDLFFVLSGFLITGILYDTLLDAGYYKKFYVRRILRIFPVYYLMILTFLLLTPFLAVHWKPAHLLFLVYLGYPAALIWPNLIQVSSRVAISHLWSLSVEEQFYMIWPWLIAKLRRPATILKACMAIGTLALVLRILIYATHWLSTPWAYAFLLCRMDPIAIGAAIAILVRGQFRERMQFLAPFALGFAGLVVVAICIVRRTVDHEDPFIGTFGLSALAVAYGGLLVVSLRESSWQERLLSVGVLRAFGKYSYGLYLFHFPLTVVLGPMKGFFVGMMHSYVAGATLHLGVNLAVNMLVAIASFHLFESPIMRLKNRFSYDMDGVFGLGRRSAISGRGTAHTQ